MQDPLYRVKRSTSLKLSSVEAKDSQSKQDVVTQLRLEPNAVEIINAYFGLVKRRVSASGKHVNIPDPVTTTPEIQSGLALPGVSFDF